MERTHSGVWGCGESHVANGTLSFQHGSECCPLVLLFRSERPGLARGVSWVS